MDYIEINIRENGSLICNLNNNYITYKEVLYYFKELDIKNSKLKIENNKITLNYNNKKINIKNYNNNRDITLDRIIDQLKIEYRKQKREFLKKKKIKRIKKITSIILISTIATSTLIVTSKNNKEIDIPQNEYITEVEIDNKTDNELVQKESIIDKTDIDYREYNINVEFESRLDSDKLRITKAYYEDIITRISNEYGIDPQIMIAIATQEMGVHEIDETASALGLMQIEKGVWNNETITAFNYEKKDYETIIVTEEKLKDLEFNIRTGCIIFQQCLKNSNYNLCLAIQMYNYGYGNTKKILKKCYGENFDFNNITNNEWLEYRTNISEGDNLYLEHILSYIEKIEDIKCKKNNDIIKYIMTNTKLQHVL